MKHFTKDDFENLMWRWGKWAYINIDKMMGANPPGWIKDMKLGYERDNRVARQNRIDPLPDDEAPEFDRLVCTLYQIDKDGLETVILYYCFHMSLSKLDKHFNSPRNHHARVKEAAFNTLYGAFYAMKIAV